MGLEGRKEERGCEKGRGRMIKTPYFFVCVGEMGVTGDVLLGGGTDQVCYPRGGQLKYGFEMIDLWKREMSKMSEHKGMRVIVSWDGTSRQT